MGPGARVLLKYPLTEKQVADLDQWVHSISLTTHPEHDQQVKMWEFWIKKEAFTMLNLEGDYQPCTLWLAVEAVRSDELREDASQYQEHLGYIPTQKVGISCGCNSDEDHRVLGQLILTLAERYNGIVDFCGAITPRLKPKQHWDDISLEEVYEYVHALPGKVYEMYYMTFRGKRWVRHLADAAFMRAWLQNPDFRMIK